MMVADGASSEPDSPIALLAASWVASMMIGGQRPSRLSRRIGASTRSGRAGSLIGGSTVCRHLAKRQDSGSAAQVDIGVEAVDEWLSR
jgi:hypothetical protein